MESLRERKTKKNSVKVKTKWYMLKGVFWFLLIILCLVMFLIGFIVGGII